MALKPNFLTRLKRVIGDQEPEYCYHCGLCTSGCPVAKFLDFRPHRIVVMVQLDMGTELLKSSEIWNCAICSKCKERCPREVAPYDVIQGLQNLAVREGLPFPEGFLKLVNSISKYGSIQQPQEVVTRDFEFRNRQSLGLPRYKKPKDMTKFAESFRKTMEGEMKL